jgi:hypothetical protein
MNIPDSERQRFEKLISAQANIYGLGVEEYLRKIWYHEEAAKLGEYVAGSIVNELNSITLEDKEESPV